ncbi:MAG: VanW family protein [Bifidobacteriaceae bacterium]|jgi:hypothetical protein|nr:VanW family protein [Bifidobacteriaceae bacterium]
MGREASLALGDVKFRNDTPWGVLLRAGVDAEGQVWVELWSTKYWTVETVTEPLDLFVHSRTVQSREPDCVPQSGGSSGFEVTFRRTKTDPAGTSSGTETWSWSYAPANVVVCRPPVGT